MEATDGNFRVVVDRVHRLAKGTATFVGLAVLLALVLGLGTAALAAVPGDPLKLGQFNSVNAITRLAGNAPGGAMLVVDNNSAGNASRALDLRSEPGRAPLTVNPDAGKAPNLDADRVDGRSFACPSGTLFHEGACIEAASRTPAAYEAANQTCFDAGRRLPTVAELTTLRNRPAQNLQGFEISSQVDLDDAAYFVRIVYPANGSFAFTPYAAIWKYRCVASPS